MAELSRFFGIVVSIYYFDHGRPHFHARFGGRSSAYDILTGVRLRGPSRPEVDRVIAAWAREHREELLRAWETASRGENPPKISPLVGKKGKALRGRDFSDKMSGRDEFPYIDDVEWVRGRVVRLFFSTGRVKEVSLPVTAREARRARVIERGAALDPGNGMEMSSYGLFRRRR